MKKTCLLFLFLLLNIPELPTVQSQTIRQNLEEDPPKIWDFDAQLQTYFTAETEELSQATADALTNIQDWEMFRTEARQQLLHMLQDERPEHKISAMWALKQIGIWQLLSEVGRLAKQDTDLKVRRYAFTVLRGVAEMVAVQRQKKAAG